MYRLANNFNINDTQTLCLCYYIFDDVATKFHTMDKWQIEGD